MKTVLIPTLLLALICQAYSVTKPIWLAVSGSAELEKSLAPLVEHRRAQGFQVVSQTGSVEEAIVTLGAAPDYLLIIGNDQLVKAKRGNQYRWLSTQSESFAADPLFSDLDGDGVPNFPVGRIPAKTPEQLGVVISKIIAYENRPLGVSDLNLPVWSGTPAYGKLLDETADWLLMSAISKSAPKWAQPWLITANPSNTLNAWPADQPQLFNEQIQKGAAFTAMMGHGATDLFLSMESPSGNVLAHDEIVYTNSHAMCLDDPKMISPPLVIFACDCGNFADSRRTSLAATLLLGRGGPVATIGATTESHPLTNYYSSIALLQELSKAQPATRVGDLWLATQLSAQKMRKPLVERLLKNVEGALEVEIDIPKLKRDQLQMYAYLGDPALAISLPQPLAVTIEKTAAGTWAWQAARPDGAEKIIIQIRKPSEPLRIKPKGTDRNQSLQVFAERNAQFAYETVTELSAGADWLGEITGPGEIRIIALGKSQIHFATQKLR